MKQIIPLIRDGNTSEATDTINQSLKTITKAHLAEEKKRVAAKFFETVAIPNTKSSVKDLHGVLTAKGYRRIRQVPGKKNSLGQIKLHDYEHPVDYTKFRVHEMVKEQGGEHVGWGHMKQKLGESVLRPVKTGTGTRSLETYLNKLHSK